MKLTILGSGSPRPTPKRACSSYMVEVGPDRVLFDHGFGAGQRLVEHGATAQSISHVFLTHHHYDHMGDLARLILTRWDQMRDHHNELEIFGPSPLKDIVDRMISANGVYATDLRARIESACSRDLYARRGGVGMRDWPAPKIVELQSGESVTREQWRVTTAEAIHCPGYLECMAYRIEAEGQTLVYTGDTGPTPAITELAKGCDLLIHMCSQTSGEIGTPAIEESSIGHREVAQSAETAGAKLLILTHIDHLENDDTRRRILKDVKEIYRGLVVVAKDFLQIDLSKDLTAQIPGAT